MLTIEQLPKVLSLTSFCSTAVYDVLSVYLQKTFMAFLTLYFASPVGVADCCLRVWYIEPPPV